MTKPDSTFLTKFPKISLIALNATVFLCFFLTLFSSDHMRDHLLNYAQNYLKLVTENFIYEAKSQHIDIEDPSEFKMVILKNPLPNPRALQIFSSDGNLLRSYDFLLSGENDLPMKVESLFDKIDNTLTHILKKLPQQHGVELFSVHQGQLSQNALSLTSHTELWQDEDGSYLFTVSQKVRDEQTSPILRFVFSDDGLQGVEAKVKAIYLKRFSFFFILLIFANWFLLGRIKTQTNLQIHNAFNNPDTKDTAISELNKKWLSFYLGMQHVFFLSRPDHLLFKDTKEIFEKPFFEAEQTQPINFAHFIEKLCHEFSLDKAVESDQFQLKISHREGLNVTIDEPLFRSLFLELLDLLVPQKSDKRINLSLFEDDETLSLFIDNPNCGLNSFLEKKTGTNVKGQDIYTYLKYLSLWHKGNFEISESTSAGSPSLRITLRLPIIKNYKN